MTTQMTPVQKTLVQAIILAVVLGAPLLFAQGHTGKGAAKGPLPAPPQAPASDRISPASLDKVKSDSTSSFIDQQTGQISQRTEKAPAGVIQDDDIYQNSIILQHGDTYTLLPPHAVIHLPESHQNKVTTQPKGNFAAWPEFYINNRNWLFTYQIGLKQATGNMPIKPEVIEQFKKINRVVVAIYQHCPISSLPTRNQ